MSEPRIEDRPIEPDAGGAGTAPVARPANRLVVWGVSAAVIGVFLVFDFIAPHATEMPSEAWVFLLTGICIGQVNLITTWAVLAPGNLVVRLPWSLLLTMAMWYALVLGNRVFRFFATEEDAIALGAVLLAGVTIAQVPLWIAKRVFRWRLVRGANEPGQPPRGPWQFQLRHLLLAMFVVAVALSPLRQVLPPGPIGRPSLDHERSVLLGAVIVCNLLVTVPCIWGALVSERAMLLFAIGWPFYCGILTFAEMVFLVLWLPPGYERVLAYIFGVNLCQGVTVFSTLLVYRTLGFRLVRARLPA